MTKLQTLPKAIFGFIVGVGMLLPLGILSAIGWILEKVEEDD